MSHQVSTEWRKKINYNLLSSKAAGGRGGSKTLVRLELEACWFRI